MKTWCLVVPMPRCAECACLLPVDHAALQKFEDRDSKGPKFETRKSKIAVGFEFRFSNFVLTTRDKADALEHADVVERITWNGNDVGPVPRLQRANPILPAGSPPSSRAISARRRWLATERGSSCVTSFADAY